MLVCLVFANYNVRRLGSVYLGVDALGICEVFFMCISDDCVSSAVALRILEVG